MNNARILVVDDEPNIRELLDEILSEEGYEVTTAGDAERARLAHKNQNYDLTLLDIWMPDTDGISLLKEWSESGVLGPVVMMSGHGTVETAVEATRLGALDFIEKPVSLTKLLRTVEKALSGRRPRQTARSLVPAISMPIGKSRGLVRLREQVAKIAEHETHVLFAGEAGSGRELFGRYLASRSNRSGQPFVVASGADLDEEGAERSLFGKDQAPGLLDAANGGTLFIRNIQELSPAGQIALADALKSGRFGRAGAERDRPLDVRVLSSLPPAFERDRLLREDLVSALGAMVLQVPALRDHSEDVPELLRYYVDVLVDKEGLPFRRFSVAAQNRLRNYPWPGNVSELRRLVKSLLILADAEEIELDEVEEALSPDAGDPDTLIKQDLLAMPMREAREHFERAYLKQQLSLCGGKVGQLAKRVGMERTHLYRKLRSLGIDFKRAGGED